MMTPASLHTTVLATFPCLHGIDTYLVGGAVRDWLLTGCLSNDIDLVVTDGNAKELAERCTQALNGRLIELDAEWGIYRVVVFDDEGNGTTQLDIANALDDCIQTDLARRDLSMNAMAIHLPTGELLDPFNGQVDIETPLVRSLSEQNMADDPLRLLRVFRFAAQLQAPIDSETLAQVQKLAHRITEPAAERIQYELLRTFREPNAFPVIQAMADSGLLEALLPELTPCRQVPPNSHHHLPLWEHTLELVRQCDLIWPSLPKATQECLLTPVAGYTNGLALVRLGCLLHDIGKPDTWSIEPLDNGQEKHRFLGHEKVGEDLSDLLLKRLCISNEMSQVVKKLVRWHLYPCQFGPLSSKKSVMRFFRRMGEQTPHVTVLALADRLATNGPAITEETMTTSVANHLWLLERYEQEKAVLTEPPLLTGKDLMKHLGMTPGPAMGTLLAKVKEAQELRQIDNHEAALAFAAKHIR